MNKSGQIWVITTTVETQAQAHQLAQTLVDERLVACAQIEGPIESIYWWENQRCQAAEWRLVLKTVSAAEPALRQRVLEIHPYQVPQWLVFTADCPHPPYTQWVHLTCTGK